MALQHLRSGTANKRPIPTAMSDGQLAVNTNLASPGLFFKDSNGDLVKAGPVHVGTTAPNASPASTAATALVSGTVYQILTIGTSDFTAVGASANTVGIVFTATGTTTGTGTVSGQQGVEKGEQWLDTTNSLYVMKVYDGTGWRVTDSISLANGSAAAPSLHFGSDTNTGLFRSAADELAVTTGGTQRVVVDSSGTSTFSGASDGVVQLTTTDSRGAFIRFGQAGSYHNMVGCADGITSGDKEDLGIRAADNIIFAAGGSTERLRIDSSGNVGIGTSSVASNIKLELSHAGSTGINIRSDGSGRRIAFSQGTGNLTSSNLVADIFGNTDNTSPLTGSLLFRTNQGNNVVEAMRIDSSGNVGIGQSSPAQLLHLTSTGSNAFLQFSDSGSGGSAAQARIGSNGNDLVVLNNTGSNTANERMRITSSGNVGIGTSSPSTKFHLVSTDDNFITLAHASRSGTWEIQHGGVNSEHLVFKQNNGSSTVMSYVAGRDDHTFLTNGSERMRIDSSGNVKLGTPGTTFANAKTLSNYLGLADNYKPGFMLKIPDLYSGEWSFYLDPAASATSFVIADDSAERMRIDSSGRLLVGTTSPGNSTADNLTIADSGHCGITLRSGTSSIGGLYLGDSTSGVAQYRGFIEYDHASDHLRFGTASAEKMRIDSSGVIWAEGIYTNTATSPNRDVYVGYNGKLGYLSSIRESKTNIAPIHDVDWLYQLAPVTFNYRTKDEADNYTDEFSNETEYGLIAEEVETVAPDLCFYDEIDGNQELRGVSYRKLITPLLAALQQSNQRIKTLEQRLSDAGIA